MGLQREGNRWRERINRETTTLSKLEGTPLGMVKPAALLKSERRSLETLSMSCPFSSCPPPPALKPRSDTSPTPD
jgi:hypothetical protein